MQGRAVAISREKRNASVQSFVIGSRDCLCIACAKTDQLYLYDSKGEIGAMVWSLDHTRMQRTHVRAVLCQCLRMLGTVLALLDKTSCTTMSLCIPPTPPLSPGESSKRIHATRIFCGLNPIRRHLWFVFISGEYVHTTYRSKPPHVRLLPVLSKSSEHGMNISCIAGYIPAVIWNWGVKE